MKWRFLAFLVIQGKVIGHIDLKEMEIENGNIFHVFYYNYQIGFFSS